MNRQTAIVTGGTGGLGLETARGLIRAGLDVTIIGRDTAKGRRALADLERDAVAGQAVAFEAADLSSLAEIRRVTGVVDRDQRPLDVLVNNAGAFFKTRELTPDGLERTMATNHFSMFVLTALLFHRLDAAPTARIVNVASSIYRMGKLDPADLDFVRGYSGTKAYAVSKLANIMFTLELARHLRGTRVTANALNPGAVRSDFNRYLKAWWLRWLTLAPEVAAQTPLYLALSPDLAGRTGGYYDSKRRRMPLLAHARDDGANARLWELSEALSGHPWEAALAASADAA